ncbi:PTS lactose/cellobiose transporter subunit IIA [Lachnospiraceae bacterium MD308]|jgi:cellobiose-specific phosphotransferase system component IIA|nr:PTS lactose/cellobiose transporter subunit IIA [Lachnospiraceae bacterium MD308]MCI8580084.1 PTS lactose/cellobiose transporter subunit IIA [Dorea sp.]
MKMTLEELNNICMEMICNAGEGRSKVFEALEEINQENYVAAEEKLTEAQEFLAEAHKIQFEKLMAPQNDGVELPFSMLLLHAMDITMVATSEHDLLHAVAAGKKDRQ